MYPEAEYDLEREIVDLTVAEQVRVALEGLSDDERRAIELAYLGGHTYREVAVLLEQPEGTVKSRMRVGLRRLRDSLVETGRAEVLSLREAVALLPPPDTRAPASLWSTLESSLDAPSTDSPRPEPLVSLGAARVARRRDRRSYRIVAAALAIAVLGIQVARQQDRIDELATYQLWAKVGDPAAPRMVSLGVLGGDPGIVPFRLSAPTIMFEVTEEDAPGSVAPGDATVMSGTVA